MKILVTYFSASGVTKRVAQNLAKAISGDLFEIVPKEPYTEKDLDWNDKNSRSSVEMKDKGSRPKIANLVENIKDYQCIFIGFPIWWYREPSIIDTFLEAYDFSGIKIVPFATSGGSGMGSIDENFRSLTKNAIVERGKRLSSYATIDELKKWAEQYIK